MTKIKIWMASKNVYKLLRKLKQKFRKIFITLRGVLKKYVSLKFPGRILNTIQEVKSPATFLIILLHKCHCVVNILMSNLHFCVISSWGTTRSPWSRFLALNALFCCQPRLEISGLTKRVIWCKKKIGLDNYFSNNFVVKSNGKNPIVDVAFSQAKSSWS